MWTKQYKNRGMLGTVGERDRGHSVTVNFTHMKRSQINLLDLKEIFSYFNFSCYTFCFICY